MSIKVDIENWLSCGSDFDKGIQLFSKYGHNKHFLRICQIQPTENKKMLEYQLCLLINLSDAKIKELKNSNKQQALSSSSTELINTVKDIQQALEPKVKIREDFPFLKEPDCPHELLILVGYKITAYHEYITEHRALFDCTDLNSCIKSAQIIINNYTENQLIYQELNYYKEHGNCLAKHPIFKQRKQFDKYNKMSTRELIRLHDITIPHRIWRIKNEIKKGNKPHLDSERIKRINKEKGNLAELNRIIG